MGNPVVSLLDSMMGSGGLRLRYKVITVPSDFPTLVEANAGVWDIFIAGAAVTDNDPSKTNTGQSFVIKDSFVWDKNTSAYYLLSGDAMWIDIITALRPTNIRNLDLQNQGLINTGYLDFHTAFAGAMQEGRAAWDSEAGTIKIGMPGGFVNLQVGQEIHLPNRPKNDQGSLIGNGKVVYISGATGSIPEVKLASAANFANAIKTIAVATEDVLTGQRGFYTTFGVVRDIDTLAYPEGTQLWLSTVAGEFTNVRPEAPNCSVRIGYVIRQHATEGAIFVSLDVERSLMCPDITIEPTGFTFPENVTVTYDSVARTITLGGTVNAYHKGIPVPALTAGWVSDPHPNVNGEYYLIYDGVSFQWINPASFKFYYLAIAEVTFESAYKFAIRECHGVMQWQTHQENHDVVGTYRKSGGTLASYVLDSIVTSDRRPSVVDAVIKDEDLQSILDALAAGGPYTNFYLSSSSTANLDTTALDIVPLNTDQPYYNQFTGGVWNQTLMSNNYYASVWLLAVPTTADVDSKKYRFLWVQPQGESALISTQQSLAPNSVSLGEFVNKSPEMVFITQVIIQYTAANWIIKEVIDLTGTRYTQVTSPAVIADHNSLSGKQLAGPGVTWGHVDDQLQTFAGAKVFNDLLTTKASIRDQAYNGLVLDNELTIGADPANHAISRFYVTNYTAGYSYLDINMFGNSSTVYIGRLTNPRNIPSYTDQFIYNYHLQRNIRFGAAGADASVLETWNDNDLTAGTDLTGTSSSINSYQRIANGSIAQLGSIRFICEGAWTGTAATRNSGFDLYLSNNGSLVHPLRISNDLTATVYGIWSYNFAPTFTPGSNQIPTVKYVDDSLSGENLWDRVDLGGSVYTLLPHTTTDSVSSYASFIDKAYNGVTLDNTIILGADSNHAISRLWVTNATAGYSYLDINMFSNSSTVYIGRLTHPGNVPTYTSQFIYNYHLQRNIQYGSAGSSQNTLETWNEAQAADLNGTASAITMYQRYGSGGQMTNLGRIRFQCEDTWQGLATANSGVYLDIVQGGSLVTALWIDKNKNTTLYGTLTATTANAAYSMLINCTQGDTILGIYENHVTTTDIGIKLLRYGASTLTWFIGSTAASNNFFFRVNGTSSDTFIDYDTGNIYAPNMIAATDFISTAGALYIGTPSTNTIGSWKQSKSGAVLGTTYALSHYEDVSGDGSAYGYVAKFTVDYNGNAKIWASPGGNIYGTLTTGAIASQVSGVTYAMLINATSGLAVFGINQNNATKAYTGVNLQRQGVEKWFVGMNDVNNDFIIRKGATTNSIYIEDSTGIMHFGTFLVTPLGSIEMPLDAGCYWSTTGGGTDGDVRTILIGGNPHLQKRVAGNWADTTWNL